MGRNADHLLENVLLLPRMLRAVGILASPEQSMEFVRALTLIDVGNREHVYYAARSMFVTRREHLDLFTTIFNRFWRAVKTGRTPGTQATVRDRRKRPRHAPVLTLMAQNAGVLHPEQNVVDRSESYSPREVLQHKAFAEMTPDELETIKRLIQEMQWDLSRRVTRRRVADRSGDLLHLRRVMRTAAQYGGVPLRLAWQRRKVKQRPLILIADVSGSMEKFARLILQFFYSVSHSFRDVECFVFGTRLTRITPQLRVKHVDRAVSQAAREVVDWSGGTRIGESLRTFNRRWGRRLLRRGAVVLIVSDGWERGDVGDLEREMRSLALRCHRLIWLNPLLGHVSYRPKVEGMAVALHYVDDFLPIHNLHNLKALSERLATLGGRRAASASERSMARHKRMASGFERVSGPVRNPSPTAGGH